MVKLLRQGENREYEEVESSNSAALDSSYRCLKTLAHIAPTLSMLAEGRQSAGLKKFRKHLSELLSEHEAEVKPYLDYLHESLKLIDDLLLNWNCQAGCQLLVKKYIENTALDLKCYGREASRLQLESLNQIMEDWSLNYQINADELRVIVVSNHGAREGLLERQFFDSWMNEHMPNVKSSNKVLIYSLGMLPNQMAKVNTTDLIEFLATQELNKKLGKQILNDENAMFKDILGEHAKQLLEELPNRLPKGNCPYS